jgi:hypothetical protein
MSKLQGHNAKESLTQINNIQLIDSAKTTKSRNPNLNPTSKTQTESMIKKSSAKKVSQKSTILFKDSRPQTSKPADKLICQAVKKPATASTQQDIRRKPSQTTITLQEK